MGDLFSLRESYKEILIELGKTDQSIFVLDADLKTSSGTNKFFDKIPNRYINVGIAEQNLVGVAAGLAILGYKPIVHSFASFLCRRALDQITISVAYAKLPVTFFAFHAGLSLSEDGGSHQSLNDISIVRSIPNFNVAYPADDIEMKVILNHQLQNPKPLWLRVDRRMVKRIHNEKSIKNYKGITKVLNGDEIYILSTGSLTTTALSVVNYFQNIKVMIGLLHIGILKPFNDDFLFDSINKCKALITIEDHSVIGGLYSIVCENLINHNIKVYGIGIDDVFGESGTQEDLQKKHGLDYDSIVNKVSSILKDF